MDILKRQRNSEDISPKKVQQTNRLEKKIKLCSDVKYLVDDFDVDYVFEDECNFKLNIENQQANFQDDGKIMESKWYRFRIKTFEIDPKNFDLITTLFNKENDEEIICRLQGPWCETKVNQNDIISVFPIWSDDYKCYVVNKDNGFFITNPDYLISGTTVVGSIFCQRKAILQEKFRGIDANNKIMVIGTIVHELMQTVLEKKLFSKDNIEKIMKEMLNSKDLIYMLYSSKMTLLEAEDEIMKFIPNIISFIEKYIIGNISKINKGEFTDRIENIQDIEENLWIPQLGLKGKIDVSVKIHRRNKNILLPLELKTGRTSFSLEHKGQVILYQMMLKEVGVQTDSGLLLYLRDGVMKEILASRNEKRDLIILRNEISNYLTGIVQLEDNSLKFKRMVLPEPINHPTACSKCPYLTICTTFLKMDTTCNLSKQHPLKTLTTMATEHLKTGHIDYFMFWCGIISLEQDEINNSNNISNMWINPPEKRFLQRKALINLQITGSVEFQNGRYIHKFIVNKKENNTNDLRLNGISKGEYVIVSTSKRLSVAAGEICDVTSNSVSVCLERNLLKNYGNETFIIDKYESKSGYIFNLTNLGLLLDNTEHISFLRDVIIERKASSYSKKLPAILAREGKNILQELNNIQQTAVLKALSTENYILIKGLPGTGKTQTLVSIIRLLHLLKKSVIITSHTHSAVDNVLLRLKKHKIPFLRLGSEKRIHTDLLEYSEKEQTKYCTTPEELEKMYNSFLIIGVTCLGSGHSIFTHKTDYDFCIIDEATQVYQPTIIRPLLFAKKFILVGDPDQLPPLIHSKKARELGGDESLFHRLDSSTATISLTLQYRMNKVINKLANDLTYGERLKCGNDSTMKASLNFSKQSLLLDKYSKQKWILKALEKHIDQSVIFLDTKDCIERSLGISKDLRIELNNENVNEFIEDNVREISKQIEQKCVNYCETAIVFILLEAFIFGGYDSKNIGIIAPYRAQVDLLKKIKNEYNKKYKMIESSLDDVEINTVDQYQGRDKEIIIYSCTKTGKNNEKKNDLAKSMEILEDRRRLTVAITRSKHKLIIIGDQDCLKNYTPFSDLINKIPNRCKHVLEDGKLGFQWTDIFTEIKRIRVN